MFAAEQEHLFRARRCLTDMQARADRALAFGERAVRDEKTVDARITAHHLAQRVADLQLGELALCFGRIDDDDDTTYHVGRRHIEDEGGEPVVVDWRAPVAVPFYRATVADPMDLTLRRRFTCDVDDLVALFDEHLDDPDAAVAAGIPDPVLAEIERGRTGEMADIVATIAAEQDEIIRAPLDELLVVQGGPGTGKTAVGLHRAAFLLYEHRATLSADRILVFGPSRVFLRYIANVLPSLGETAVTEATIDTILSASYPVRGLDTPEAAAAKGDLAMAEVLRRLALDKIRPPDDPVAVPLGVRRVIFTPEDVANAVRTALDRRLPLNDAGACSARSYCAMRTQTTTPRSPVPCGRRLTFAASSTRPGPRCQHRRSCVRCSGIGRHGARRLRT